MSISEKDLTSISLAICALISMALAIFAVDIPSTSHAILIIMAAVFTFAALVNDLNKLDAPKNRRKL